MPAKFVQDIEEGTVIDHLPSSSFFNVAEHIDLKAYGRWYGGSGFESERMTKKDLIKIDGHRMSEDEALNLLQKYPGATVNTIYDGDVEHKYEIKGGQLVDLMPEKH